MTEPHQSDLTRAIQAALKLSQYMDLNPPVDVASIQRDVLDRAIRAARAEEERTGYLGNVIDSLVEMRDSCGVGETTAPRPARADGMSEDDRAAHALLQSYRSYTIAAWEDLSDSTREEWRRVLAKARELLAPQVDREGLAKALADTLVRHTTLTAEVLMDEARDLTDAAITYMGARPVDETAAKNWQLSYDKACRERDECKAELAEAKKVARLKVGT